MWLLSALSDFTIFQPLILSAKKFWDVTLIKDVAVSLYFLGSVLFAQIGFMNSCWCRSGAMTSWITPFVDLNPLTESEWLNGWILWLLAPAASLICIFWLIWLVGNNDAEAMSLLNRSREAKYEDVIHNNKFRAGLDVPVEGPSRPEASFLSRLNPFSRNSEQRNSLNTIMSNSSSTPFLTRTVGEPIEMISVQGNNP